MVTSAESYQRRPPGARRPRGAPESLPKRPEAGQAGSRHILWPDHDAKIVAEEPVPGVRQAGCQDHGEGSFGTVAVPGRPNRLIFAVAYGSMGNDLAVHAPVAGIWNCYAQLWESVYQHGQRVPLAIPLIGSGLARVDTLDRENLIRLILLSFVSYSRLCLICHELRIVIFPGDAGRIDPVSLYEFLQTL